MMKRLLLMTLTLTLAMSAQADSKAEAEKLTELLSDYRTYQASFSQYVSDPQGERVQETHGELKARRPGEFYWHAEPPMEQVIVTSGDEVKVYDPDLMQVTVYPMDERLSSTPALLLSGEVVDLEDSFHIQHEQGEGGEQRFILEPVDQDSLFLELIMTFEDGVLHQMRLHDSLDQHSRLVFSDIVLNESIDDDVFELEIPDGVDVLRNEGQP